MTAELPKRVTAQGYLEALLDLAPRGLYWTRQDRTTRWARKVKALAEEMARADGRLLDLLDEADPQTTDELLGDLERLYGLPDPCVTPAPSTKAERRAALAGRMAAQGGQTPEYFISVALALGYVATIYEYRPPRCTATCTDPLSIQTDWTAHCTGSCVDPLGAWTSWAGVWNVEVSDPDVEPTWAACVGSVCTDPLRVWAQAALECTINRIKPAHTLARFLYEEAP